MSYKISSIPFFDKQAKRLVRKYPSLKNDLTSLSESLVNKPDQGKALGNNFYKIRLAITSKGKGKLGGARVVTHIYVAGKLVYLFSIYDKSEKENITEKELKELLKLIQ